MLSDSEDIFGVRMYGGLRTFALLDHLLVKSGPFGRLARYIRLARCAQEGRNAADSTVGRAQYIGVGR